MHLRQDLTQKNRLTWGSRSSAQLPECHVKGVGPNAQINKTKQNKNFLNESEINVHNYAYNNNVNVHYAGRNVIFTKLHFISHFISREIHQNRISFLWPQNQSWSCLFPHNCHVTITTLDRSYLTEQYCIICDHS